MFEYIRREESIKKLSEAVPSLENPDGSGYNDYEKSIYAEAFADAIQIVKKVPTSFNFVSPHGRGHWIVKEKTIEGSRKNKVIYCDICGQKVRAKHNYCPNCGSIMKNIKDFKNKW